MRKVKRGVLLVLLIGALHFGPAPGVWAGWIGDGTPLCTATNTQEYPTTVSDGAGGAIVAWNDYRSGNSDIYGQRVDASGAVQWTTDGVALCTATGGQWCPTIVSDGAGGAIVAWLDDRSGNYDIYAQRVDAWGMVQWTTDGVALCTAAGLQLEVIAVSDGAGGAIVAWRWHGEPGGIYAQRVDASGAVQWTDDGVALCTASGSQLDPRVVSDGAGGAIVTWYDDRSGNGNFDIYAQRVDAWGMVQWTADGVALCTATGYQIDPTIVSDGAGGAILSWEDYRSPDSDIYAQRVDASGAAQWTTDGVALCTASGRQHYPTIAPDCGGGAIVSWEDDRSGYSDIYAQRVDAWGMVQWTADGVALCTATGDQDDPAVVSDGAGGAIVTWIDARGPDEDIYAQRITHLGNIGSDQVPIPAVSVVVISLAVGSLGLRRLNSEKATAA